MSAIRRSSQPRSLAGSPRTSLFLLGLLAFAASGDAKTAATTTPADPPRAASVGSERIVFTSNRPLDQDLVMLTVEGGQLSATRLQLDSMVESDASLSPDGRWLVFAGETGGNQDLFALPTARLDSPAGALVRLTESSSLEGAPALSPDGSQLAYTSTRSGRCEVWVRPFRPDAPRSAESSARNLTPEAGSDFRPAWSPDGRWLAYSTNAGAQSAAHTRVQLLDLESGSSWAVHPGSTLDGSPRFSGDGAFLYLQRAEAAHDPTQAAAQSALWRVPFSVAATGEPVLGPAESISQPARNEMVPTPLANGEVARLVQEENGRWVAALGLALPDELGALSAFSLAADSAGNRFVLSVSQPSWELNPMNPQIGEDAPLLHHQYATHVRLPDRMLVSTPATALFPSFDAEGNVMAGDIRGDLVNLSWPSGVASRRFTPQRGDAPAAPGALGVFGQSADPQSDGIIAAIGMPFAPPQAPADLFRIDADGSARNLTPGVAANDGLPKFSRDGERIVFRSGRDGNQEIYLMDRDGSNLRRLTHNEATDTAPALSPDGRWVAFTSTRDGNHEIYRLHLTPEGAADGVPERLTSHGGIDMHPSYSPDGTWLVFASDRGGEPDEVIRSQMRFSPQPGGELWALRLADGLLVRLTDNLWEDGLATWGKPWAGTSGIAGSSEPAETSAP